MAMQKKILKATIVSPVFSSGADNRKLELRTTEWKALMRTVFRWASVTKNTKELYEEESEIFGGSDKGSHASPIRIQLLENKISVEAGHLVKRRRKKKAPHKYYVPGSQFNIVLRKYLEQGKPLTWYEEMLKLSTVLGGVGKRSRRGRGVITFEAMPETKEDLLIWLTERLNGLNKGQTYVIQKGDIVNKAFLKPFRRPVIEKILIGKEIGNVFEYLSDVDLAAHEVKGSCQSVYLTGSGKGRFASSLIVSVVQTGDKKIYPIYTFIKPVKKNGPIKFKVDDREDFYRKLEVKKEGKQ